VRDEPHTGPRDTTWREAGIGHSPTVRCWFCDKPRNQIGGKIVGRLRLFKCAQCRTKESV
jgi:hypothetical protein